MHFFKQKYDVTKVMLKKIILGLQDGMWQWRDEIENRQRRITATVKSLCRTWKGLEQGQEKLGNKEKLVILSYCWYIHISQDSVTCSSRYWGGGVFIKIHPHSIWIISVNLNNLESIGLDNTKTPKIPVSFWQKDYLNYNCLPGLLVLPVFLKSLLTKHLEENYLKTS